MLFIKRIDDTPALCGRGERRARRGAAFSVAIRLASASIIRCRSAYLVGVQPNSRMIDALFSEVNPIPVKKALNLMGWEAGPLRAPLTEMEASHAEVLKKNMKDFGIKVVD